MPPISDTSVIIPSNHSHNELLNVVHHVCRQTVKPAEIVIVDSSDERGICPAEIAAVCASNGIGLVYECRAHAFPGQARNIGLGIAKAALVAFIDVQTIARPNWLETSLSLLAHHGVSGIWGATCFGAETTFECLVRDGFFGVLPRRTLPGSIFRREVFDKVGQFIEWVRAGEDTEWMLRLELLKIPVVSPPNASIDYVGLIGSTITKLLKKWRRNYTASRDLPHLFPQKVLLWTILYPFLVLIAFNWNYLIADWRMDSPLYIGHVTKIAAIVPAIVYVFVRGILLPLKRGTRTWQLVPARFVAIAFVCFMADFVKVLVFSVPKLKDFRLISA